jgi:glycerol-3-phosphate responsive antiterminator
VAWDIACMCAILVPLKVLELKTNIKLLRVTEEEEMLGIDLVEHVDPDPEFLKKMQEALKKSK